MKYLLPLFSIAIICILSWLALKPSHFSGDSKKSEDGNISQCECRSRETRKALVALNMKIEILQSNLDELKDRQRDVDSRPDTIQSISGVVRDNEGVESANVQESRIAYLDTSISMSAQSGKRDPIFENDIITRVTALRPEAEGIEDIVCSAQFCRAQLKGDDADANDRWTSSLTESGILEGEAYFVSQDEPENDRFNTVVYFSRAGFQLPQ